METGFRNVVILILSLVSSYLLPIAISCTVYIALLVVKKRIGQNKINVVEQANLEPHDSSDGPTFYAVQMQQNETSERNNQPTSKEDVSNVLNDADADARSSPESIHFFGDDVNQKNRKASVKQHVLCYHCG